MSIFSPIKVRSFKLIYRLVNSIKPFYKGKDFGVVATKVAQEQFGHEEKFPSSTEISRLRDALQYPGSIFGLVIGCPIVS